MSSHVLRNTLNARKKALRKAMTLRLRELSPADVIAQSRAVIDGLLSSQILKNCSTVGCYLSTAGEVDTSSFVTTILRDTERRLFVPRMNPHHEGTMDFVRLYDEEDFNTLPAGPWGIREPTLERHGKLRQTILGHSDQLDIIIVPGVAFDRSLSRLGHGKGYYDRFLTTYTAVAAASGKSRPFLVALAFKGQVLEDGGVPVEDHDWKMDAIIAADETITGVSVKHPL